MALSENASSCGGMMGIICWSRNAHRTITTHVHVAEIVYELLNLIGRKVGIIPGKRIDILNDWNFRWSMGVMYIPQRMIMRWTGGRSLNEFKGRKVRKESADAV